ncbi:fimbrial protein FimH [Klebsiella quasipneumoniae]|nr:fimbrial protein FimH [Klebsiella quasipneumoniae]
MMKKIIPLFTTLLLLGWSMKRLVLRLQNGHRRDDPHRRRLSQRLR